MNKEYEALLDLIDELKDQCQEMEQRIIDEKFIDMNEYREKLKELFYAKIQRDYIGYNEDDEE